MALPAELITSEIPSNADLRPSPIPLAAVLIDVPTDCTTLAMPCNAAPIAEPVALMILATLLNAVAIPCPIPIAATAIADPAADTTPAIPCKVAEITPPIAEIIGTI